MQYTGDTPLRDLPGIGPARAARLEKLGLELLADMLEYFPRDYEDRTILPSLSEAEEDATACFRAMVIAEFQTAHIRKGLDMTRGKIADDGGQVLVTFFNQAYVKHALISGEEYVFYGKLEGRGSRRRMTNPYFEKAGGECLTGRITPVYHLTAGISNNLLAGLARRALECVGEREEVLPVSVLQEVQLAQTEFSFRNIHFPDSWEDLNLARRRLIFEELFCLSAGLSMLRGHRRADLSWAIRPQNQEEFLSFLPYAPTEAQNRVMDEIARDMMIGVPMNRLLQGDVGSGKTTAAAFGIWLAWKSGCQAAFMVPTELLAEQHYRTLCTLFAGTGLRIGLLTGSVKASDKRRRKEELRIGELDLIIGTHALLTEDVEFSRLALVITDEQHRFGVEQRAVLAAKAGEKLRPHVLVMSATPIPRTLALMIYGDLDLSVLDSLPPGRKPVATFLIGEDKRQRLYRFVREQAVKGRQVYHVCPAVDQEDPDGMKAAEQMGTHLQKEVFPSLRIGVLHGRMKPKEKESVMESFVRGEIHILVSTTVIEVGVDVPNATMMLIENAERFGLSQLHQLRGRVGRGSEQSYCILITSSRSESARGRLKTLTSTTDGFQIAEEDLKLRGPGDFFGARQHGLPNLKIANLTGDMRLLREAQEAARNLLRQDPALKKPEYSGLRRRISRLFEENRDIFN